jgi:hypothetical protein
MVGSFLAPVTGGASIAVGAGVGGLIGGGVGFFTGGEKNSVGTGGTTDTTGGGNFQRPVESGNVSAYYGQKGDVWSAGYHKGTDYAVPTGTPVYAAASGVVSKAHHGSGSHSLGLYVAIEHSNGYTTIYAHLSQVLVRPGDAVIKGQLIAKSGESGHVTGPHLHFEVRKGATAVDPGVLLTGGIVSGESSSSGSNEGNGRGNSIANNAANNILDIVLGTGGGGSAVAPAISFGTSGVKGNFQTTSQMVAQSMSGGMTGISSPVVSATGRSLTVGSGAETTGIGGESSAIGLGVTSRMASGGKRAGTTGYSEASSSTGPVVNISVNIARASEAEAMRLVDIVKTQLENDALYEKIGRR